MSDPITPKLQLAVALHQAGRLAEAQAIYQEVLKLYPQEFNSLHLSGVIALQTGKRDEGLALIDRAIAVNPGSAPAHNNRGNALKDLQRLPEALASYERTLSINPGFVDAWNNRGNVLLSLKRPEEALASYDRALALKADDAEVHNNRGNALMELSRAGEALASYDRALALKSSYAEAHNNRGNALLHLKRMSEALAAYDRALALKSSYAEAHNNRGNALKDLGRPEEALAAYDKAAALRPAYAEAFYNRANLLLGLKRPGEATASYDRAFAIDPAYDFLAGTCLYASMMVCDWRSFDENRARLAAEIAARKPVAMPFAALAVFDDPGLHKIAADVYAARNPRKKAPGFQGARPPGGKIRVGYYSADFHNHATAYLVAEFLEARNAEKFEIYGFSFGPNRTDEMRARLSAAFDRFFEVSGKSDRDIAEQSRALGIDIAVDLKGYTEEARTGIFAAGCAPLQVSYLGYPGTMGAGYIDYIVADKTVIPPGRQSDFTEKVVYLPHSYQCNDSGRKIAERVFTQAEAGLPAQGFVFCCFNAAFKIQPRVFDGWMRILKAVPGSVLWLLDDNQTASDNLRKEAALRGVDGARLIFAQRLPLDEHLARHRLAGLFLDTLPYNAHTTASDALWAGLPVLTRRGEAFAGRVAASLLTAVGLHELVTDTEEAYEAKAIALALAPAELKRVCAALEKNRETAPLFDGARFARHLESAYETMFARYQAGVPPAVIDVQP